MQNIKHYMRYENKVNEYKVLCQTNKPTVISIYFKLDL